MENMIYNSYKYIYIYIYIYSFYILIISKYIPILNSFDFPSTLKMIFQMILLTENHIELNMSTTLEMILIHLSDVVSTNVSRRIS